MALSERIKNAFSAARQAAENAEDGPVRESFGMLAMGDHWTAEALAETVQRHSGRANKRPMVLLTRVTDVEAYQIDGVITEHIPAATANNAAFVYSGNKISSVIFKWRLADLLPLDEEGANLLEETVRIGVVVLPTRRLPWGNSKIA